MSEIHDLDRYAFGEEQRCFGCGPHNDRGWRLRFTREGESVVTRMTPPAGEEGPPGIFHGGLQATLLDEVAGWTLVGLRGRMGFTTSLQVRYVRPARIGEELLARGRIARESETGRMITVRAAIEQGGKTVCTAKVTYAIPDRESAERTLGGPLPASWERYLAA